MGYHEWVRTLPTPVTDGLKDLYLHGIRRIWLDKWLFDQLDGEVQRLNPHGPPRPPKPYNLMVYNMRVSQRERNP